ncbi:RAMP superfamily CRISPR-associated protein [Pseudoalteromonas rubra]|uniref:CRISPR type III-associated protein domain-containing protein n=1 Tax=Pseudoalteromonas rubra TaxID=43658 RepID=A0A0F4QZL0_9GAMM|nr:RAMP superfamily CRISPR-associated protein [Pseudoalteromonas rubra]KJZ12784.1 hypothetical protein TW77_02215 [Pseudoalteromonas rubra]
MTEQTTEQTAEQTTLSQLHLITVKLTVLGPIVTQHSGALAQGVDVAVLRDDNNQIVLPGTLLKGNIRHALNELAQLCDDKTLASKLHDWFGQEGLEQLPDTASDGAFMGSRGRLNFDFYWPMSEPKNAAASMQTRIELNEDGVVEHGSLMFIESPYEPGELIEVQGQIRLAGTQQEARLVANYITKALDYCHALGSFKSIGFGRIESASTSVERIDTLAVTFPDYTDAQQLVLEWRSDRPLCMADAPTNKSNEFRSRSEISGAILKGVMARQMKHGGELARYLERVTVSHAMPLNENGELHFHPRRSIALYTAKEMSQAASDTASTNNVDEGRLRQHDFLNSPHMPDDLQGVLTFASDFKGSQCEAVDCPPDLPAVLLVRNAISSWLSGEGDARWTPEKLATRNTAKEEQLFSYLCVSHRWSEEALITWRGHIDLSRVPPDARAAVYAELCTMLEQPLVGVGKTKAVLSLHRVWSEAPPEVQIQSQDVVQLTLRSPTCLLNTHQLKAVQPSAELYQQAFEMLAPGVFDLQDHFAYEELRGGSYWYMHFQKNFSSGYRPYIETQPGSCFALSVRTGQEEKAQHYITQWLRQGLPSLDVPEEVSARYKRTPYDHANGFGQVHVQISKERKV